MLRSPGEFQCKSARVPSWALLGDQGPVAQTLRSRGLQNDAWASESWLVGVVLTQGTGAATGWPQNSCQSVLAQRQRDRDSLGLTPRSRLPACWALFSCCHHNLTPPALLAVGSNKLRCPGASEVIKPSPETLRKLEPKLKKIKRRSLSAGSE